MDKEPEKEIYKILCGVYDWGKNNKEIVRQVPKNGEICIVDGFKAIDKVFVRELTLINLLCKWIRIIISFPSRHHFK